jgi:fumarate hydratase class II
MVCCRVYGNDAAIALAGSQGNFELNVYKPLMAHAVLQSIDLLDDACRSFQTHCIDGLEADTRRIADNVERSLMLVTALAPRIGYDKAAAVALAAWREGQTLREAALAAGVVTEAEFDAWVRPEAMLAPSAGNGI